LILFREIFYIFPSATGKALHCIFIIIIIIVIIITTTSTTAIIFSLYGSSPYSSTDKTNNIHKRSNTKTQYKQYKTHLIQAHILPKHPHIKASKHTHTHTPHPHFTKSTQAHSHTLQKQAKTTIAQNTNHMK
jgi:hypothetical protein